MSGNASRRGPWWRLFESTGTKFGTNLYYLNAWCKSCVAKHIEANMQLDAANITLGHLDEPRTFEVLKRIALGPKACTADELQRCPFTTAELGARCVQPIYGRAMTMSAHAWQCQYTDREEVARVSAEAAEDSQTKKEARAARANIENAAAATRHNPLARSSSYTFGSSSSGAPLFTFTPESSQPGTPSPFASGFQAGCSDSSPSPAKRARTAASSSGEGTGTGPASPLLIWDSAGQEDFAMDVCRTFVSCRIPWHVVDNPEFRGFFRKYLPSADLPDRRALSGRHLNRAAAAAQKDTKERVEGELAMGSCDGWKNTAKTNVVSSVMSVQYEPYLTKTHDMTGEPKTGDRMFELIKSDIRHMEDYYGVEVIGWCTDDGPDGKKARRLLFQFLTYLIVIACWAHQINLVVGDLLGLGWISATVRDSVEIVKWFNNHSVALELLKAEQRISRPESEPLALIRPVQTRWTSHFLACQRLLFLSADLRACVFRNSNRICQSAGRDTESVAKVYSIVAKIKDEHFWDTLRSVQMYLEPLAIAANVTQASDTRLDHVLLTLANLYQIFTAPAIEEAVRDKVVNSLERRWKKADQDVFILAAFFNPYIRGYCFNSESLPALNLLAIARRVYQRIFNVVTDSDFMQGILDYSTGAKEFSGEAMILDSFLTQAKKDGKRVNITQIWQFLNHSKNGAAPSGRTGVARLAVRILSIVANSADSERVFSEFGAVHTDRRLRLAPSKVHKSTEVKMHLNRHHTRAERSVRKKRKFGEDIPTLVNIPSQPVVAAGTDPEGSRHPSSSLPPIDTLAMVHPDSEPTPSLSNHDGPILDGDFEQLAQGLIEEARVSLQALEESSDDEDFEAPAANEPMPQEPAGLVFPPTPTPQLVAEASRRVPTYTHRSPKTNIPLASLFNYRRSQDPSPSPSAATVSARASGRQAAGIPSTARLDFFWDDGARSLARETSFHDALEADAAVHGSD